MRKNRGRCRKGRQFTLIFSLAALVHFIQESLLCYLANNAGRLWEICFPKISTNIQIRRLLFKFRVAILKFNGLQSENFIKFLEISN